MNNAIQINGLRVEHGGNEYICDFKAHYEVLNARDGIYVPEGMEQIDRPQDDVNFVLVQMTDSVRVLPKFSPIVDSAILARLEEDCLDWCRDDIEVYEMALKDYRSKN